MAGRLEADSLRRAAASALIRLLATQPRLMPLRVKRDMQARHDDERFVTMDSIVEAVGEALEEKPARLTVGDGACTRESDDRLDCVVDNVSEPITQTGALLLVPTVRRPQIGEGLPQEPNVAHSR